MAADPDERVDRRPGGRVVEDALKKPAGVAGAGRPLGQGHAFGDLDDPERIELAGPRVEQGRPDPDELLGGPGVGDGDEDPGRERGARHPPSPAPAVPAVSAVQRSTRYGLRSSNSRAWRSTRSSASSVVILRFSMTKLPTRPK